MIERKQPGNPRFQLLGERLRADVPCARRPADPRRVEELIGALGRDVAAPLPRFRFAHRLAQAAALLVAVGAGYLLASRDAETAPPPPPIEIAAPSPTKVAVDPWTRAEEWRRAFDRAMSDERRRILIDAERVYRAVWSGLPRRLFER